MAIKTISLTGSELSVTQLNGINVHIRNDGANIIYAAKKPNITIGADGVLSIPSGQSARLDGISGTVYLLGTGLVQIISNDYIENPFKISALASGSGADEIARAALNTHAENTNIHVTTSEKLAWNSKAELSDISANFTQIIDLGYTETDTKSAVGLSSKTTIYRCENWIDYPSEWSSSKGTLISVNFLSTEIDNKNATWTRQIIISPHGGSIYERYITDINTSDWKNISDGGNASTLEGHPASDFVLKSEYDTLAAKIQTLEMST